MQTVLIGIPVLNRKDKLPDILNGLLKIEYPHKLIRIVLVDGDSTDGSFEILEKFKAENGSGFREVEVARGGFRSLPKSRNYIASKLGDSDYLWFLDSDVLVNPDSLQWMIKLCKEGYGVSTLWQDDRINKVREEVLEIDTVNMACALIEASIIKKMGSFDERLVYLPEDLDFCIKVRTTGIKIAVDGVHPVTHLATERFRATRGLSNRWSVRQRRTDAFCLWTLVKHGYFGIGTDTKWPERWAFFFLMFLATAAGLVLLAALQFSYLILLLFIPIVALFLSQAYKRKSVKGALFRTANAFLLPPCTTYGLFELLLEMKSQRYRRRRNLTILGVNEP